MIKVMGTSPDRVPLTDLSEFIYYKQKRIFSDEDYSKSKDLQKAIKSGKIIIIEEAKDSPSGILPQAQEPVVAEKVPAKQEDPVIPKVEVHVNPDKSLFYGEGSKLDMLLDKIDRLESKIETGRSSNLTDSFLQELLVKIKELEQRITTNVNQIPTDEALMATLKSLESKITKNAVDDNILHKIQGMLTGGTPIRKQDSSATMETYIPSISIEDANTHINLNVRTIEKSDNVNSALDALKKMRNPNK